MNFQGEQLIAAKKTLPFYLISIDSMTTQSPTKIRGRMFWQKKPQESVPQNAQILYNGAVKLDSPAVYGFFLTNKCPPLWLDVALWRLDEATHGDDTPQ